MNKRENTQETPLHVVAAVGVVIKENKFLAGKRDPNDQSFPGKYALPGGKVEVGETVEEALRQELREEAGVEIGNIHYVTEFNSRDISERKEGGSPVIGLIFVADYAGGEVKPGDDMVTMEWMTLEEARQKDFIPGTIEEVEKSFTQYKNKSSSK